MTKRWPKSVPPIQHGLLARIVFTRAITFETDLVGNKFVLLPIDIKV